MLRKILVHYRDDYSIIQTEESGPGFIASYYRQDFHANPIENIKLVLVAAYPAPTREKALLGLKKHMQEWVDHIDLATDDVREMEAEL